MKSERKPYVDKMSSAWVILVNLVNVTHSKVALYPVLKIGLRMRADSFGGQGSIFKKCGA